MSHRCSECNMSFRNATGLSNHQRAHKNTITPYDHRCYECNMSFRSASGLSGHQRVHNKTVTTCDICGAVFKSAHACASHMQVHPHIIYRPPSPPPPVQQRFMCSECPSEFCTSDERFNHMADSHQIILPEDI